MIGLHVRTIPEPASTTDVGAGQVLGQDLGVGQGPVLHHGSFDASALARRRVGVTVSVCIPARDEERTVAGVVGPVHELLTAGGGGVDLVDELIVVDDGSSDATAARAAEAGAGVVSSGSAGGGKGLAMRAGLAATTGDLVVFLDADVTDFAPHFVVGLLGPLLDDAELKLVKAFYERPLQAGEGGGRVTELVARPAIDLLFPELAHIRQPLAGETALRRAALGTLELEPGYGVELGLLVDMAEAHGTAAIAQVDLGVRAHRNRPLAELRPLATDVLRAALRRAGAVLAS
jgi:glucosyl-3-phosphoglycerate synthase